MSSKADLSRLLAKRNHKILDLIAERDAARAMADRLARSLEIVECEFAEAKYPGSIESRLRDMARTALAAYRAQTEQDRPK